MKNKILLFGAICMLALSGMAATLPLPPVQHNWWTTNAVPANAISSNVVNRGSQAIGNGLVVTNGAKFYGDGTLPGGWTFSGTNGNTVEVRAPYNVSSNHTIIFPPDGTSGPLVSTNTLGSSNVWKAVPLGIGQYLTFNGNVYVPSNLPPSSGSSGPTTNAPPYVLLLSGTNFVIDFLALGPTNDVRLTLTNNSGLLLTNIIDGKNLTLEVFQNVTGSWNLVTNGVANYRISADIPWIAPTTNAGKCDTWKIHCSGTNGQFVGVVTGFSP